MKKWSMITLMLLVALASLTMAAESDSDTTLAATAGDQPVATATAPGTAFGQASSPDKWRFSVTPISVWGLNIEGPTCLKGICHEVNASFGDIKDKISSSAGIGFEIGKGNWAGIFSGSKIEFTEDPVRLDTGIGTFRGTATLEWDNIEAGFGYRLPMSGEKSPKVQILGGLRFVKFKGHLFSGPGSFNESKSISWTDPFFGMSLAQPMGGHWAFVSKATIAGFGATSHSSKLTWDFTAGAAYKWMFSGWGMTAFGGYKASELDYRDDDPKRLQAIWRVSGPVFTLGFDW